VQCSLFLDGKKLEHQYLFTSAECQDGNCDDSNDDSVHDNILNDLEPENTPL